MPLKGVKSAKRQRQYKHIKDSARKRGRSLERAEEIAARTVNKQRAKSGETRSARKAGAKKASAKKSTRKASSKTTRKTTRKTSRKSTRKTAGSRSRRSR